MRRSERDVNREDVDHLWDSISWPVHDRRQRPKREAAAFVDRSLNGSLTFGMRQLFAHVSLAC